jgi:DNA-binding transcriptional LysR family regulator
MSPELKHLRYFVAVAEELSFSAAARRLYLSQQALSRIIQQLEQDLGVKLFERTTRSVRLTPAGEATLGPARRALAAAEDAVDAARRAGRGAHPPVLRVDISSSGIETGAMIMRRFRRDHPDIAVRHVEDGVPTGLVALQENRLDVLLGLATYCPLDVSAEVVRLEPVVLGMARDHPLAALPAVPVARLTDVDLLLPSDRAAVEWVEFVASFCRQAGARFRRWPGVTRGSQGAAEVVRDGACVVPTARWTDPPPDLVFRPLVEPTPILSWALMTAGDSSGQVDALLESARAVSAESGWLQPGGVADLERCG